MIEADAGASKSGSGILNALSFSLSAGRDDAATDVTPSVVQEVLEAEAEAVQVG